MYNNVRAFEILNTLKLLKCGPMVFDDLPIRTKENTIDSNMLFEPAENGFPLQYYICLHSGNHNIPWEWNHEYHLRLNNNRTMCTLRMDDNLFNIQFDFGAFTNEIYFAFDYDNHAQIYMVLMGELGNQQYLMRVNNLLSNVLIHEPLRIMPIFYEHWRLMPYGDESKKWLKKELLNDFFQRNHSLLYTGIFESTQLLEEKLFVQIINCSIYYEFNFFKLYL